MWSLLVQTQSHAQAQPLTMNMQAATQRLFVSAENGISCRVAVFLLLQWFIRSFVCSYYRDWKKKIAVKDKDVSLAWYAMSFMHLIKMAEILKHW